MEGDGVKKRNDTEREIPRTHESPKNKDECSLAQNKN
jgi:hypothetical protein